jgi:signal peptidase I
VHAKGNVDFITALGEIKRISNVLYIPSMKKSLLFVGTIIDRGYTILFDAKKCIVVNPRKPNSIVAHGNIIPKNGLYKLEVCVSNMNRSENKAMKEAKLWHRRMGHVNFKSLH